MSHRDGDEAWAHLDPAGLPPNVGSWCNPLQADAEAISAGRAIYTASCASCHGDRGKGDGPGAGQSDIRPFDFTQPMFAGMREPPGTAVEYTIITRGIDGTTMAAHGNELSGWERLAVIAYLATFPPRDAITQSRTWADSLRARRP